MPARRIRSRIRRRILVSTFSSVSFDMKEAYFAYARAYAGTGNLDKAVEYLAKARSAGFSDWPRILSETEFEKIRDDPKVQAFLKS